MAIDSIIARPMKSVLEMDPDSSGCWAMATSAWETARPSARAGPIEPTQMQNAEETIDTEAIKVVLSIQDSFKINSIQQDLILIPSHSSADHNRSQHGKNIGLYLANQQFQRTENDGKNKGDNADNYGTTQVPAQDISKKPDCHGQGT